MRRRVVDVVAATAVVALVGAGAACSSAGTEPRHSALAVGYYGPADALALTNLTVVDGSYWVAYVAEVQFFSRAPGAVLECGLVDASGRIGYLDDRVYPVPATGAWTRIGDAAAYDVPEVTLGIRCSPSIAGPSGVGYRGVSLTAEPIG